MAAHILLPWIHRLFSTDIRQIPGGFGQGSRLWPA